MYTHENMYRRNAKRALAVPSSLYGKGKKNQNNKTLYHTGLISQLLREIFAT